MSVKKLNGVTVNPLLRHESEIRQSLSGDWGFRLDKKDLGVTEQWFKYPFVFMEKIKVPGCWQGQGFGGDSTELHKEFFTEIRPFKATYEGVGWYSRIFRISKEMKGKKIWLSFGGANPTAEIWLNGIRLGENRLPFVPFAFDVTDTVNFDGENHIAVRISEEDRLLGMTYYYCGKWSGLYRDVELFATEEAYFESFSVIPNADTGEVKVKADIGGRAEGKLFSASVTLDGGRRIEASIEIKGASAEFSLKLDQYEKWSPDSPKLYRIDAELRDRDTVCDCRADRFGFLSLATCGKHFLINGEPYYMRGTGDFGENPKDASPSTDRDYYRKSLGALRAMGYNYVRCQSFVPVPEYFDAADELGMIIQSEMGMLGPIAGYSMYHTYSMWPKPTPDYREDFRAQWNAIVQRDVNHPSASFYCMSNELKSTFFKKTAWRCYGETKAIKPYCFVIWTDGGHRDKFPEEFPADFINEQAEADALCDMPVIQHEFMWWSSYPDVSLADKYKDCATRHFSAELAISAAGEHGITHILPEAAKNSQVLQFIEAKGKMEALRRDYPTLAGVCHFNAMDTGMSPQGLVDIFYEPKYVTSELWRQTNGDTVILCSLDFNDRIIKSEEKWNCKLFVSDFSHPQFTAPILSWSLSSDKAVYASGNESYEHKAYMTVKAADISVDIPVVKTPERVTLKAELSEGERRVQNEWELWIFPGEVSFGKNVCFAENGVFDENADVVVTRSFDGALCDYTARGGAVVLLGSEGLVRPFNSVLHLEVGRYFFTHPASFPPYEELQSGTIIKDHPMLGDFPHKAYADLAFYNMIGESPALDLEPLGFNDCDPIIRMLHSYQVCRSLGYIVERRLGKGLIIVTSLGFCGEHVESLYLLSKITEYATSKNWTDCPQISEASVDKLISESNI